MGIGVENNWISMGQRIAKYHMQSGVKLHDQRRPQQAIGRWRSALRRLTNAEDRFITLGYLVHTCCDIGNYQQMLKYALQQMDLANNQQDNFMKSEALLNLAKAHERLADFGKAIIYGRASLQYANNDSETPGHAHLVVALSQLALSQFQASLEAFEKVMCVANQYSNRLLELQACIGLGVLFTLLRDFSKAILFLRNALAVLEGITINDLHAKYRSVVLYHLSVVLRKNGSVVDARATCDEAMKLAQETGNCSVFARCLCSMANICCSLGESEAKETLTKSWFRYEEAYRMMHQMNDHMGEVIVLGSMAKSASEYRTFYTSKCECQAIQLNKKCLELAKEIGCKYAMMRCYLRLQDLYNQLNDEDSAEFAKRAVTSLIQEMELFCNFCGQQYGLEDDSLQALRCSHIFHEKCLQTYLAKCLNPNCPKCQCKAVIIESLSPSTSSISSFIANSQQQFTEGIPMPFTDQKTGSSHTIQSFSTERASPKPNSTVPVNALSNHNHKILPLPISKVDDTLPISSVPNLLEELCEDEPLALLRRLSVTDV